MENSSKRTAFTVVLMVAATLISKALGLFRDILLASNYGGSSAEAVAFEAASRMPTLFFDFVIGGVITAAFIPVFSEVLTKEGKDSAMRFANRYLNFILLISLGLSLIGMLGSSWLVGSIAPGLAGETAALAVSLTRVMFPQVIFTALAFCYVGILQSLGEFNLPAVISLVSNGIIVIYYYTLNDRYGIYGLACATIIGWAAQAAVQAPRAQKLGYRYVPTLSLKCPHMRRSLLMAGPILVSTWMQPFCNMINTRFASGIENGRAITAIGFATRLYLIIVGIFSFVATNLIFPKLSVKTASGKDAEARRLTSSSIKLLLTVILPISAGVFILAEPFITVIYMRGEFTADDMRLTAEAMRFFALGMPFLAANEVLTKLFFSRKDTKPPMLISVGAILLDLVLVILLSGTMGVAGIALSTGIAVAFSAICHCIVIFVRGERLFDLTDAADILKMLASTFVMAAAVWFVSNKISNIGALPVLLLSVLAGAAVYAALLLLLKTKEIRELKNQIFGGKND